MFLQSRKLTEQKSRNLMKNMMKKKREERNKKKKHKKNKLARISANFPTAFQFL